MPATATKSSQSSQVTVYEDTSFERLFASELGRLLAYIRPWLAFGLLFPLAMLTHHLWGHMPAVPWAASALWVCAISLGIFTWSASRLVPIGRAHSALTMGALVAWLAVATITGPGQEITGGLFGIFGAATAASWDVRLVARTRLNMVTGEGSESAGPAGRLSEWFRDASKEAGITPAKATVTAISAAKAEIETVLPPGKTHADLQNKIASIESAGKIPPGALTTVANPDRADGAKVVLSDPRVLTSPIPFPGPYAPGASIAAPLRPGLWQDGEPVMYVIVGHHIFMMGASGSGKSVGGCWNLVGEIITRPDAVVLAADITKGAQTFGPLLPGLHRFESDPKGARSLVDDVHSVIKPRTNWLAERGLQKWQTGCGLSYLVVWYGETPDIWDKLSSKGEENLINTARALRSAGGTLVFEVQRNTWDQVPTIIRSQMASMCFGLNDAADCKFGLSEAQQEANVNPAEWGTRYPGKAVLDAPTIPLDRIAMPLRTYAWGDNADLMAAHAAAYPASERPVDPITAQICSGAPAGKVPAAPVPARPSVKITRPTCTDDDEHQGTAPDEDDPGDPVGEVLATVEDPSPLITADITDPFKAPIEPEPDDAEFEFAEDEHRKMTPEDARAEFAAELAAFASEGRETFSPKDLYGLMERTGMSRAWIQARLRDACEADNPPIERDENGGTYRLLTASAV
jgi:hypothetical protein